MKTQIKAMEAKSVSSHFSAHHGPQSDMVNGTNAYEYPGKRYSSSPHKDVLADGCVGCHKDIKQLSGTDMFDIKAKATFHELGSGWAGSKSGSWSEAQIGALWNYKMIIEDRSRGVHNATYTMQVLYDTLKALNPRLNESLRPR